MKLFRPCRLAPWPYPTHLETDLHGKEDTDAVSARDDGHLPWWQVRETQHAEGTSIIAAFDL